MIGKYKNEKTIRVWKECEISDIYNKILKTEGKYYNDVPPEKLTKTINFGTHIFIVPYKFLIGPVHESNINFNC